MLAGWEAHRTNKAAHSSKLAHKKTEEFFPARHIGTMATKALIQEASLANKPGLVCPSTMVLILT